MAGRMRAAPRPSSSDQPNSRTPRLGAAAVVADPNPYTTSPMASVRRYPRRAPILPPVIMNEAITSAQTAMAVWMPVSAVVRSLATYWIDTFMTELSSVMRNWADAKTTRTKPDPERSRDTLTAGSLGVPLWHGRDRSRAVRPE